MSGGADAQSGFVYQQDYAAFRILGSEAKRLLIPDDDGECFAAFRIEGRQTAEGPAWDVAWTLVNNWTHLRECKDTAITRADRQTFYLRVRQEIAEGTNPSRLSIGWVTDAGKQDGNILRHLTAMRRLASTPVDVGWHQLPERVDSGETALREALYYLSSADAADSSPLAEEAARTLLSQLSLEHFSATELAASVEQLAPRLFDSGAGRTIRALIQGELSTTIQREGFAAYGISEFMATVGNSQLTLALAGKLRELLSYHSAASPRPTPLGISWSCRPERPPRIWPLAERLRDWDVNRSCVLAAQTGVGKSTSSRQMFAGRAAAMNPHHVLLVETASADLQVIDALPELCCMLCGVSPTWLTIDGLDQVAPLMQGAWRQAISRLLMLPSLTIVITARREVLAVQDWMQEQLAALPEILLEDLTIEQVVAEFEAVGLPPPQNAALLSCLRNAFLFSIYAKTVTDAVMPLTDRGEVTAFNIIEEYFQRRVRADSQGARSAGVPERSATVKRAAIGYLADRTLSGDMVVERPSGAADVGDGIETLCREGVLLARTTNTVAWSHTWLREYAVAERLLEKIENPTSVSAAAAVSAIAIDHAARLASVGVCKWIVAHPEIGRVEEYVSELYERHPGLSREALTVLLEDSPQHLQLDRLPALLVAEALSLAREMKASQWLDQVVGLPMSMFEGTAGRDLYVAALQYESEMTANG